MNHEEIERKKLFTGICLALFPTAFSFILVSNVLGQLKNEFILTNADVGYIGGAALWGMAISLLVVGPFLEKIGLKKATFGAFLGHLSGVTLFLVGYLFAGDPSAFWILFLGAIGMGVGNGMIEVAGNPLTAALYPDNKTTKLNHFHSFYPAGLVLGGLLGWIMTQIGAVGTLNIGHWTAQIAIVYIPILLYGWLLLPRKFPKTETAEAGIPIYWIANLNADRIEAYTAVLEFLDERRADYPALIASRLGIHTPYVERRCGVMADRGLLEPVSEEVVYRITDAGGTASRSRGGRVRNAPSQRSMAASSKPVMRRWATTTWGISSAIWRACAPSATVKGST